METTDRWLSGLENALRTVSGAMHAGRPNPAFALPPDELDTEQRQLCGALMRVNHVGEVCAQALYAAQALSTQDPALRKKLSLPAKKKAITWLGRAKGLMNWVRALLY